MARYSEFINFPIYLYASKEVDVPADEAADESDHSDEEEDAAADDEGVADDGASSSSHDCVNLAWMSNALFITLRMSKCLLLLGSGCR